jgi:ribosomal protein L19
MPDIHDQVEKGRTALEKLTDFIPGWNGYQKRKTRRKADKVLRQTLAEKLADQVRRLEVAQKEMIAQGRLDLVDDLGSAVTQLQTFIDRIRFASYGYAGVFDAVKIQEPELERLYNFDAALVEYVDRLAEASATLRDAIASGENLEEVVSTIQDITREANSTFDQREHVILEGQ